MKQQQEISRMVELLKDTFNGTAWHGPSVMKVVKNIDTETAFKQVEPIHTIAELVAHMTAWRIFTIKRLLGQHEYDVMEKDNFPKFRLSDDATWTEIIARLEDSQDVLIETLYKHDDQKLLEKVENKAYNYYTLIHGIIQHDIYHTGQIILISKLAVRS
ncbi:MAG: DinB family protein [Cyclobacteriaceae bacterium]|nr:DinB family protein [Cyclobacteriaceae bacterium]